MIITILAVGLTAGVITRLVLVDKPAAGKIKARSAGESQILKIWGQLRLALVAILTFLASQKILNTDAAGVNTVLEGITTLLSSVEGIIAVVGMLIASVGSWFAKEKA